MHLFYVFKVSPDNQNGLESLATQTALINYYCNIILTICSLQSQQYASQVHLAQFDKCFVN